MYHMKINREPDGMPKSVTFYVGPVGIIHLAPAVICSLAQALMQMAEGAETHAARLNEIMEGTPENPKATLRLV